MKRALILACLVAPACKSDLAGGEGSTDTGTGTGGPGSTGGEGSTGTGGEEENLLVNPGFEEWAGSSPLGWMPGVGLTVEQGSEAPAEGAAHLRAVATEYAEIQQSVGLAEPLAGGESLAVELSYRRVDGDTTPVGVDLYGTTGSGDEVLLPALVLPPFAGDAWTVGGGGIVVPEEISAVRVAIVVGGLGPQTVDVDAVRLWTP